MKHANTLILNQETMVEALQEYLNKRITPNVTVSKAYTKDTYMNEYLLGDVHVTLVEVTPS